MDEQNMNFTEQTPGEPEVPESVLEHETEQQMPEQEQTEPMSGPNPFDIPETVEAAAEPQPESQSEMPQQEPPQEQYKSLEEMQAEADRIFRTEEEHLRMDMEAAAMDIDKAAREEKLAKMAEDAQQRQNILMKILHAIAHVIRYVVDPSYRHDCQIASALERRADINAQVKAFEARKADLIKEELDKNHEKQQDKAPQGHEEQKETQKEERDDKRSPEKILNMALGTVAKELIAEINQLKPNEQVLPEGMHKQDRYGILKVASDDVFKFYKDETKHDEIMKIIEALQNYKKTLENQEPALQARGELIMSLGALAEKDIADKQMTYNVGRQEAICLYMQDNPRHILTVPVIDISKDVAQVAYEKLKDTSKKLFEKQHPDKEYDEQEELRTMRNTMRSYPPIVRAFDSETQKKQLVIQAAMTTPEALAYMDPEAIDQKTVTFLTKRIETTNIRNAEHGKELIDIRKLADEIRSWAPRGGAAAVLATELDKTLGQDLGVQEQAMGPQENLQPEIMQPEIMQPEEAEWNQMPDNPGSVVDEPSFEVPEELQYEMARGASEYEEEMNQPVTQMEPEAPEEIPWKERPEFESVIEQIQPRLTQYQMLGGPTDEELKLEVLQAEPTLYQHLDDNEKTLAATIEAVSRDLSLIKYVPEEDQMPEYEDRDELKAQILAKTEQLIKEEARRTKENAHSISTNYSKVCGSDSKEAKDMKRQLKNRTFNIQADLSRDTQDYDEH